MKNQQLLLSCAVLSCASFASEVRAVEVIVDVGADLRTAMSGLQPGDVVLLAPGTHTVTSRLGLSATGTAEAPIVIRSQDEAHPALIERPDANQNVLDVDVGHHVVLRGLRFTGGSRGIRLSDVSDLTITNCEVFNTGDVAISANDGGVTYDHLTITHNQLHDTHGTGEGLYMGCNGDDCRVTNSLIANNWVHHTNADDVEQGDGIEIKVGSFNNVIRDNIIHDTNYPCITLYGTLGHGDVNQIVGNAMWRCGDNGIQVAADANVHNNIIVGAAVDGIHTQVHDGAVPGNLDIRHNTIVGAGDALALRAIEGAVVVANNAVYSDALAVRVAGTTSAVSFFGNVGVGGVQGADSSVLTAGSRSADLVDASTTGTSFNAFPLRTGALPGAGSAAHVLDVDFNGTDRNGVPDVGAYVVAATNPVGLSEGFKGVEVGEGEGEGEVGEGEGEVGEGEGEVGEGEGEVGEGEGEVGEGEGEVGEDEGKAEGCACTSGSPASLLLPMLGLLGLRRRRR